MYGKLFASMYDGTLASVGPWEALVTFQQLIILADIDGCVDMTAEAIARRTTIPLDIIRTGITALLAEDHASRSPIECGRRIVPLSPTREWGWKIVNYQHYRKIRTADDRREYMRTYQADYRKQCKHSVNTSKPNKPMQRQKHKQMHKKEEDTPLRADGDVEWLDGLKANAAYSHIDLTAELAKMDAWLTLPKNKNRKKTRRFILNWLNKIDKPVMSHKIHPNPQEEFIEFKKPDGSVLLIRKPRVAL